MKKIIVVTALIMVAVFVFAAQDTAITQRELRDPLQLETWLEANASDAQTRLAAVEGGGVPGAVGGALASGKIVIGNSGGTGEAVTVSGDLRISNTGVASLPAAVVETTNCSAGIVTSLGKADTAIQSGSTFNAAAAAYDISGHTNGVLAAARGGAGTTSGIMKANGSGTVSAAVIASDYNGPASYPVYTPTASADVTSNTFAVAAITTKSIVLKSLGEAFTVILPNASSVGQELRVQCSSAATTNAIVIADSGNVECGSDWTGGVNDVIEFWSQDGTNWICTGTQDND